MSARSKLILALRLPRTKYRRGDAWSVCLVTSFDHAIPTPHVRYELHQFLWIGRGGRLLHENKEHDGRRLGANCMRQSCGHVDEAAGPSIVPIAAELHRRLTGDELQDGRHGGGVFG